MKFSVLWLFNAALCEETELSKAIVDPMYTFFLLLQPSIM